MTTFLRLAAVLCSFGVVVVHAQTDALTAEELAILQAWGIGVTTHNDNNTITVSHHGYPNHTFDGGWGNNPNTVSYQNYSFNIPKHATVAAEPECAGYLGPIGLSLSGAAFYNPYTGQGNNAVEGDCKETFDACSGHPSPNGAYHYHKIPTCIYTGADLRNKLLGVAFDGYPIYGPMDATGKVWTAAELDECNGHTDTDGRYKYRATEDFPYILGCYRGNVVLQRRAVGGGGGGGGNRPPPPGRRRRHASHFTGTSSGIRYEFVRFDAEKNRIIYKRQINVNNPCLQNVDPNWQSQTCYAWCENPGDGSYDNCPIGVNGGDSNEDDLNDVNDGQTNKMNVVVAGFVYTLMSVITVLNFMFWS